MEVEKGSREKGMKERKPLPQVPKKGARVRGLFRFNIF
jgi:hypothetical protein